jgi:hypothetical protein
MNKLDFVIIGGMKCGTTALGEYFKKHPEVNFCNIIETDTFSYNKFNLTNDLFFDMYFSKKSGLKGESSPTYSHLNMLSKTPSLLSKNFPELKIILIVRNPIKRIESNLSHNLLRGDNIIDVQRYLEEKYQIIDNTKFGHILREYLKYFNDKNILVVKFEDLVSGEALNYLCWFLNLAQINESLPVANKTDERYYELGLIKFYKKNYVKFMKFNLLKVIKKPLKAILEKLFSKKLNRNAYIKLSEENIKYINRKLEEDAQIFNSLTGFNYFFLNK